MPRLLITSLLSCFFIISCSNGDAVKMAELEKELVEMKQALLVGEWRHLPKKSIEFTEPLMHVETIDLQPTAIIYFDVKQTIYAEPFYLHAAIHLTFDAGQIDTEFHVLVVDDPQNVAFEVALPSYLISAEELRAEIEALAWYPAGSVEFISPNIESADPL